MSKIIPDAVLAAHTAILGKTGSGKTTTAKLCVEQVFAEDFRVCILDPVKSDWWGLTSSADGKRPGLPFTILGGPHGHVPLHHTSGKAIAEVVANGSLRHSILDMAEFPPGGVMHFFVDFVPKLMAKMKGVLYLVWEEAHEFAPKERAGFGKENMSIHYAKAIATAGRSKGIRLIVLDQRTQALHNAVLGSCESMIVHRFTAPADQEPVTKWLKGNVKDKVLRQQIDDSIPGIATGSGWICSGEAKIFELRNFPKAKTFDNSKSPDSDEALQAVKTAPVDTEQLRSIIGEAVKEAEANDPVLLRKKILELEALVKREGLRADSNARALPPVNVSQACKIDHNALGAHQFRQGFDAGVKAAQETWLPEHDSYIEGLYLRIRDATSDILAKRPPMRLKKIPVPVVKAEDGVSLGGSQSPQLPAPTLIPRAPPARTEGGMGAPERKFLTILAQRQFLGKTTTRDQLAIFAGYSKKSGHVDNTIGGLRTKGWAEGPGRELAITDAGLAALGEYEPLPTGKDLVDYWLAKLGAPERKFLTLLIDRYPDPFTRNELADAAGYARTSGHVDNTLGGLRALGLILGPGSAIVASEELF
jgi:hypothetical protein